MGVGWWPSHRAVCTALPGAAHTHEIPLSILLLLFCLGKVANCVLAPNLPRGIIVCGCCLHTTMSCKMECKATLVSRNRTDNAIIAFTCILMSAVYMFTYLKLQLPRPREVVLHIKVAYNSTLPSSQVSLNGIPRKLQVFVSTAICIRAAGNQQSLRIGSQYGATAKEASATTHTRIL